MLHLSISPKARFPVNHFGLRGRPSRGSTEIETERKFGTRYARVGDKFPKKTLHKDLKRPFN